MKMKHTIEKILRNAGRLDAFNRAENFHIKVENAPYMPLSIERHGDTVIVTHYFEQNGDLVPDPDMEFVVTPKGEWFPVAIQHSTGHYFQAIEIVSGGGLFEIKNPKMLRDLQSFARQWGRNLVAQGFDNV